jgi:hypothetical protein
MTDMMRMQRQLRSLTIAAALAVGVLGAPIVQGQALATSNCTQAVCGPLKCTMNGKEYDGGDIVFAKDSAGRDKIYVCDGNKGTWIILRTGTDPGPVAPLPTVVAP